MAFTKSSFGNFGSKGKGNGGGDSYGAPAATSSYGAPAASSSYGAPAASKPSYNSGGSSGGKKGGFGGKGGLFG